MFVKSLPEVKHTCAEEDQGIIYVGWSTKGLPDEHTE